MAEYGFEVWGPSGELWLRHTDMTTRFIGVYRLYGVSGRISHSAIRPDSTTYQYLASVYYNDIGSDYTATYADANAVPDFASGYVYLPQIVATIGYGYLDWRINDEAYGEGIDPKGSIYLFLVNYDG